MTDFLTITLLLLVLIFLALIFVKMSTVLNEAKKSGKPINYDTIFVAFVDLLITIIPEFIAKYKEVLNADTNEEKMKIVVAEITHDVFAYLDDMRDQDIKIEAICKLLDMVPDDLVIDTVSRYVTRYIEEYISRVHPPATVHTIGHDINVEEN